MTKRFFTTSEDAWRVMLRAITHAQRSVYLEMYIFEDNTAGYDFVATLEERARAGVRVVVILDAVGSYNLSNETRARLIRAGVELMFYRYWLHRTHRKVLLVDDTTAFVGGVNVSERFALWADLVVRVDGPVIKTMVRSFARAYVLCGGQDPVLMAHAHERILERTRTWFFEHGLGGKRYVLRRHYETHLDAAREHVTFVTPYFVPAAWLVAALGRARKRGVQVDIILPRHSDFRAIDQLHLYYAAMLTQLGAQLYLYPTMLHAKAMLVDDRIAVVGSHNLDALSFGRNVEAGVFFETPGMVRELRLILERWKAGSVLYEADSVVHRWYDAPLILALRLVQSFF